jgi:hypothetical protein
MHSAIRVAVASAIVATATFIISADTTPASEASEVQLKIGDLPVCRGSLQRLAGCLSQCAEDRAA